MTLEVDFFQAAVKDGRQPSVGLLVVDFDETLSVSDTTSIIIDTAIADPQGSTNGENASTAMNTRCASCNMQLSVIFQIRQDCQPL